MNWVKARADCSVACVLKELEQGARTDIEEARKLVHPHEHTVYSIAQTSNERFAVVRVVDPILNLSESIDF